MPLATIKAIAGKHETWVVYLVLQLQVYESHHFVEGGMSGISFSPVGLKPSRDLDKSFFFKLEIQLEKYIWFRGVCYVAGRGLGREL